MPKPTIVSNSTFLTYARREWLQVLVVLGVALLLRCWRLTNPVLDWHAFRQADTVSVTREYLKQGIDLLRPTYHDLSNIQSGQDNPMGYRMVEFPLINAVIATVIRTWPSLPLVLTSRVFSILAACLSLLVFYDLLKRLFDRRIALASFIAMAVMPYAVYYGRVILPEPYLLLFGLLALWFFTRQHSQPALGNYLGFAISMALALLLKPFIVFYAGVFVAIHLWWWQHSPAPHKWRNSLGWVLAGLAAIVPFWGWRDWIAQFPSGIPASDWLFNSNGIRWRPAWFRWLGYERLTKLMVGYTGLGFLLSNGFNRTPKDWWLLGGWWSGILLYFTVIATGNVQHDYYQVLAIPVVALSLGRGGVALWDWLSVRWSRLGAWLVTLLLAIGGWGLAFRAVSGYFNVNHWEYVVAGAAVDQLTPPTAKVIAPAFGDTLFLFQTNRTGWPIGFEIANKITKGATHYVTTSYDDEARTLEKTYNTLKKTDLYLLLDLTQLASQSATLSTQEQP